MAGDGIRKSQAAGICSFFKSLYWVLKVLKRSIQKTLIRNFLDILETIISMTGFHLYLNTPSLRLVA